MGPEAGRFVKPFQELKRMGDHTEAAPGRLAFWISCRYSRELGAGLAATGPARLTIGGQRAMKVILTHKIEGVGEAGTVKNVADGYARNYLLARGLAVPATEGALRLVREQQAADEKRLRKAAKDAQTVADQLAGASVKFKARVGEQDRLYGSVTSADIADAIANQLGKEVDRRKIDLEEPIRHTGTFEVNVKLAHDVAAMVYVIVEPEE
jgi:large subunit ribosomal protein L9